MFVVVNETGQELLVLRWRSHGRKARMWVFRFNSNVHRKLINFEESSKVVVISKYQVKRVQKGEGLEILVIITSPSRDS